MQPSGVVALLLATFSTFTVLCASSSVVTLQPFVVSLSEPHDWNDLGSNDPLYRRRKKKNRRNIFNPNNFDLAQEQECAAMKKRGDNGGLSHLSWWRQHAISQCFLLCPPLWKELPVLSWRFQGEYPSRTSYCYSFPNPTDLEAKRVSAWLQLEMRCQGKDSATPHMPDK